ncbi:MAG: winged helix-turn-helix transcriptional regulator [Candidatus Kerfeldbacteria bacterium]|nr:winged helix-turn-helix transcriptional regulator [Candidatus Kerfeldbacteria bacterium]
MKEIERSLKALANRRRLAIVKYLKSGGEASVGDKAESIHLSLRATSKHLSVLATADITEREQRGALVLYRLAELLPKYAKPIITLL